MIKQDEYRNVQNSLTLLRRRIKTRDLDSDINIPISPPTHHYPVFHSFLFLGHPLLTPALQASPLDFNYNLGSSRAEPRYRVAVWAVTFSSHPPLNRTLWMYGDQTLDTMPDSWNSIQMKIVLVYATLYD